MIYEIDLKHKYEQGVERGIKRGIKQGLEQGVKQGLEQGLQQGRMESQAIIAEQTEKLKKYEEYFKSHGIVLN